MNSSKSRASDAVLGVQRSVPFVHVADVEASLAFYAQLGFSAQSVMKDPAGRAFWALAQSGQAEMMFARASGPIDAAQQAVLFYMYCTDVAGLREQLLASGLYDGRVYNGVNSPNDGRRIVFTVAHPEYMPAGEVRVGDPDGYVILIGQLGEP